MHLDVSNVQRAKNISLKIQHLDSILKKHYISLLDSHPNMAHPKLLCLARSSIIRTCISFKSNAANSTTHFKKKTWNGLFALLGYLNNLE